MRILNLFATVLLLAGPAFAADMPATISVTGDGRVEAVPDMATVSLGVTTEAATAGAAMAANSDSVRAVIARLKAAGIEDRDIQTSGLALGPRYDYGRSDGAPPVIVGYSVSSMITVRVRALGTLGSVLDGVVSDGANTLNGLSFGIIEEGELIDEARRRAVAEARRKAGLYADAAGVALGRVISISEPGGYAPPMPMAMAEANFAKGGEVPVASGEVNFAATVTMVYEISQ